jgi:hypothetical protein
MDDLDAVCDEGTAAALICGKRERQKPAKNLRFVGERFGRGTR